MSVVSNVLEKSDSLTVTEDVEDEENSLDKSKLYAFLKKIGFNISQKGVKYIVEILCYCYSNNILTTGVLKDFYKDFTEKNYLDKQKIKWNIEDSLTYLVEKSQTKNDALLCSFLKSINTQK